MNNRMREIAFTLFSAMNGVPSRTGGEQQQPVASTTTQHTAAINREALIPLRRALQRRRAPILAINTGSASAHALFVDVKRVLRALSDVAVRREPQRPFNVLVIGGTGTGKTSLILSIRHAVERGAARADSGLMSMPLPPLAPSHAAVLRYKRHHLSRTIASVNMEPALCFFELDGGDTGWPALERESDAERTFWTRVVGGVNETDDAMATIMATDFEGNARNRIDVCLCVDNIGSASSVDELQRNEAFVQHSQNVSRLCALVGRLTSVGTTATLVLSHRDLLQIDPHALRAATDLFPHVAAHAKFVVTNYFRNRVERLESEDETDIRLLTLLNTALIRLSVLYSF